jgi:glycosyltransferase involved in cell wall biosynthesis
MKWQVSPFEIGKHASSSVSNDINMEKGNRSFKEKGMKISVIVPVYNEVKTIETILRRIAAIPVEKEIIVVDDGSTDGTREVLTRLQLSTNPILLRCFLHERNQGKGTAIRTALEHLAGDVVVIQDADLEYHPEDYPSALRLIQHGWADAVYGSRFLGPHRVFLFWHYIGNKFLTFLANVIYNAILTDMESGFKMIRTEVFRSLGIHSSTFDFEVEITAKLFKRGYRVYEIPITYTGRTYEEGKKIVWKDGLRALWSLIKFRFVD